MGSGSFIQQASVLGRALNIFEDRSRVRGDLWARHDAEAHLRMAEEKLARVRHNLHDLEPIDQDALVDDALDCINFCVFIIREVTGEKPDGTVRSN